MKRFLITAIVCLVIGLIAGLLLGRQLPPTREQVLNYVHNLSVGEFSDFAKRINAQLGFQALPQRLLPAGQADSNK
jgi:hypothetical protein